MYTQCNSITYGVRLPPVPGASSPEWFGVTLRLRLPLRLRLLLLLPSDSDPEPSIKNHFRIFCFQFHWNAKTNTWFIFWRKLSHYVIWFFSCISMLRPHSQSAHNIPWCTIYLECNEKNIVKRVLDAETQKWMLVVICQFTMRYCWTSKNS